MEFQFVVPGIPIAQPRQRHRVVCGHAQNYTPAKHPVNKFKADTQKAVAKVYQGPPLEGPLFMEIDFVLPRPGRLTWKTRPMPREPHTSKPDRDNLMKSLQDALNGFLYVDDSQLCDGPIRKLIAAGNEEPHTRVTVRMIAAEEATTQKELFQ